MTTLCYIALALAASALVLASCPYLRDVWYQHSRQARWQRRVERIKAL